MSVSLLSIPLRLTQIIYNKASMSVKTAETVRFATTYTRSQEISNKSTVDPEDVKRHTDLKDDWWKLDGSMKALHSMNLIRVPFIRDGIVSKNQPQTTEPLKGLNILDVGCGGGILSEPLARLGAKVTGIDASPELIELAKVHSLKDLKLQQNMPEYICITAEDHSVTHMNKYDAVVASEVIEHVDNKELFVESCSNMVKSNGKIFFTTPSRTRLNHIGGILIAENILKIVPKGTHDYDKLMTPNELTFLLERNKLHVEKVYGMMYNFITNNWYFINSQTFMFAIQAVKIG